MKENAAISAETTQNKIFINKFTVIKSNFRNSVLINYFTIKSMDLFKLFIEKCSFSGGPSFSFIKLSTINLNEIKLHYSVFGMRFCVITGNSKTKLIILVNINIQEIKFTNAMNGMFFKCFYQSFTGKQLSFENIYFNKIQSLLNKFAIDFFHINKIQLKNLTMEKKVNCFGLYIAKIINCTIKDCIFKKDLKFKHDIELEKDHLCLSGGFYDNLGINNLTITNIFSTSSPFSILQLTKGIILIENCKFHNIFLKQKVQNLFLFIF